ncbi:MAG: UDP-N-acetylmuramoyl-L-alanine--D-glutamate ligase [Nitrospinaceae bacterium]
MELKNKKITVIGMGRSGIAAANFLAARGARTTLIDGQKRDALAEALGLLHSAVRTHFETSTPEPDAELIILSPGVDSGSSFLRTARDKGVPVWSEIELASRFAVPPLIAVTGTNGKSTCTALIGHILKRAGKIAPAGGNIGIPFISLVGEVSADYLVLEISSFQLETIHEFHPRIAVVLNITPDHLDRHKTLDRYAALKGRIAENQTEEDFLILNHDDPHTRILAKGGRAKKIFFSIRTELPEGAFLRKNMLILRLDDAEKEICSLDQLRQVMRWQVENILAAAAAAALAGVEGDAIASAVKEFSGMEHRLEWVRSYRGIDFINDSKGTNVGAVQKSLGAFHQPVILIAGGKDKATDFEPLKEVFKKKVKHLILMGETKSSIRRILNGSFSYEEVGGMKEAVHQAVSKADRGDVVLLSPACASFDMFRDYADRGNQFKTLVNELGDEEN